jgi:transposase
MTETLFPLPDPRDGGVEAMSAPPRVQRADRRQLEFRPVDLESLLPEEHRARVVWDFVEGLDLTAFYGAIKAVDGHAGRPAIDPAILMALWLYATLDGVGSARALARLCDEHDAYRWICGGVSVNYHTLADFRVADAERLDAVLTTSVASLLAEGVVELTRVAQDGVRVRANAASGSFRREGRLQDFLAAAEGQVAALREDVEADPGAPSRRETAARARAARERQQRVRAALAQLPEFEARRRRAGVKGPARLSTTDPDARVMKMPDGGYRPAFNAQFMTTTGGQVVVGVAVTNRGTDQGQLGVMVAQVRRRYGVGPAEVLADGGFVDFADIRAVAAAGGTVYAPPPGRDDPTRPGRSPWRPDDAVIGEWRRRMYTAAGQAVYRLRAATSECINAQARNRGLRQVLVRGLTRVRAAVLWYALAHNVLAAARLRTAAESSR